jgi:hypothetical protein
LPENHLAEVFGGNLAAETEKQRVEEFFSSSGIQQQRGQHYG